MLRPSRLEQIAGLVPPAQTVADIGCDHGILGQILLERRPEVFVIASDISRPSLAKAEMRLPLVADCSRFDLRLGSGLQVLQEDEAEVIVIAGLGGRTLCEILTHDAVIARSARHLLLSPHSCPGEVRQMLAEELDLSIENEWIVEEDGRFYPVLLTGPGGGRREDDPFWYDVGRFLSSGRGVTARRYIEQLRATVRQALRAVGSADPERAAALRLRLGRLEEDLS